MLIPHMTALVDQIGQRKKCAARVLGFLRTQ
jgi:hypothetical protein